VLKKNLHRLKLQLRHQLLKHQLQLQKLRRKPLKQLRKRLNRLLILLHLLLTLRKMLRKMLQKLLQTLHRPLLLSNAVTHLWVKKRPPMSGLLFFDGLFHCILFLPPHFSQHSIYTNIRKFSKFFKQKHYFFFYNAAHTMLALFR
jgi:hypothetical protein